MAQKTVLRRLLSKYGFLSIEMMNALSDDEQPQYSAEAIRDEENLETRPVVDAAQTFDNAEEVKDDAPASQPKQEDKPDF
jgi:recombination protein RecT